MPAILELDLALDRPPVVYPARLHGAACALLGHPPPNGRPDFSVWPLVGDGGIARWRLGWLPADRHPTLPAAVTFGDTVLPVVARAADDVGFAELAASPPARRADVEVHSPTYFSRNGRDLPVPDPELMLRSPLERWNAHAPGALGIDDDLRRALLGSVYVVEQQTGTVRGRVGHRMEQTGFTGTVTLGLTRTADTRTATAFAALLRYAAVTGLGAQTGHGFGAVTTHLHLARTDQLREPSKRVGARKLVSAAQRSFRDPHGGERDQL